MIYLLRFFPDGMLFPKESQVYGCNGSLTSLRLIDENHWDWLNRNPSVNATNGYLFVFRDLLTCQTCQIILYAKNHKFYVDYGIGPLEYDSVDIKIIKIFGCFIRLVIKHGSLVRKYLIWNNFFRQLVIDSDYYEGTYEPVYTIFNQMRQKNFRDDVVKIFSDGFFLLEKFRNRSD